MINWLKTLRKKETPNPTERSEVPTKPTTIPNYCHGRYKVYVRHDEINGQLVESLVSVNWPEFLNKPIPAGSTEDDLAHILVPGDLYVVGKRLVKFLYLITTTRVIVCDLARLTPQPEDQYDRWKKAHNVPTHAVDLDNPSEVNQEEKEIAERKKKWEEERAKLKKVDKPIYL